MREWLNKNLLRILCLLIRSARLYPDRWGLELIKIHKTIETEPGVSPASVLTDIYRIRFIGSVSIHNLQDYVISSALPLRVKTTQVEKIRGLALPKFTLQLKRIVHLPGSPYLQT